MTANIVQPASETGEVISLDEHLGKRPRKPVSKGSDLLIRCLENEGVEYIFGVPGEENIDVMDSLVDSPIQFVTTRHEQGAAFMADVYGRLIGRAGVCLSTLGPGATNLVTGVADANMDRAPLVAIAGQGSTNRMHKESHQMLDLVNLFEPITRYSKQIPLPEVIPEVVRKAFKVAQQEKPGCCFIDFPENVAGADMPVMEPLRVQSPSAPVAPAGKCSRAADSISASRSPIIMVGNGVVRSRASAALVAFAEQLNIPVATTFMAKGAIPASHPLSLGAIGMKGRDYVSFGFDEADLVICIGVDMVEYHPRLWNPDCDKKILHIDNLPAEVDRHYILESGIIGDIRNSLKRIGRSATPRQDSRIHWLVPLIREELEAARDDDAFPMKPGKVIWDLRQALDPDDIVISDVGAHKVWMARMYQAERPNSCIISNGFASMGIALPGAIAARLACPDRKAVAVCGDGGFMMNNQEIDTALRLGLDIVVLVFNDSKYGLIEWHQLRHFNRSTSIDFVNPDFVKFAESFGARGYRVNSAEELLPTLREALNDGTVSIIDCPVDSAENMRLTEKLTSLGSPFEETASRT